MLAPWLLYATATGALIAVAGVAAESFLAAWRRPRRGVWLAAIVLAIGVPTLVAIREPAPIADRAAPPPRTTDAPRRVIANAVLPRLVRAGDDRLARATAAVTDRRLVRIWVACSASLLGFRLIGAVRLHRQTRNWRLTAIDGGDVLVTPEVGPAVVGFIRPRIVLPAWSLALDPTALSLILRHEREHIRAGDSYLLLFAAFSTALLPWNLAVWFMARRLVVAVELDCDQRVLRTTASVRDYGLVLLEVVRRRNARGLLFGASLIQPRGFLARRIHAMVTREVPRPRLISLALATSIAALTVAAHIPQPAPLGMSGRLTHAGSSKSAHVAATRSDPPTIVAPRHIVRRAANRASQEPKPRITASWENAPIDLVVEAFARFSGRKISTAADVSGLITARVDDQPWEEALSQVMALHGYRVVVRPDSSITIVAARRAPSENRRVSGRVTDETTGLPIVGVFVNVAGRQAIGEPNRTCTTDGGRFELKVPDGEVWLDASAAGYEFARVTLAPSESRAVFAGRRNLHARSVASIQNLDTQPHYVLAVRSTPIIVIDRVVASPHHFDVGSCSDR